MANEKIKYNSNKKILFQNTIVRAWRRNAKYKFRRRKKLSIDSQHVSIGKLTGPGIIQTSTDACIQCSSCRTPCIACVVFSQWCAARRPSVRLSPVSERCATDANRTDCSRSHYARRY